MRYKFPVNLPNKFPFIDRKMWEAAKMDIVERLRDPLSRYGDDCYEAADEIERLRGERWNALKELEKEVLASRSEIERLREALWKIVKVKYYGEEGGYMESDEMRDIARSALQPKVNEARILATNKYEAEGRN